MKTLCIFIFSVPLGLSNSPLCLPLKLTAKDSTEALTNALIASLFSTLIWPHSSTLYVAGCIGAVAQYLSFRTYCSAMLQWLHIVSLPSCQDEPEHNWNRVITQFHEAL